jgi:Reverse transcriptase (RNA-dependent DNA polymerase)
MFDPQSVNELIDIVGCNNKYNCSIDLWQGYHHIPLKASDHEKTTFSTGGLAGKLLYQVLPYGLKNGRQIFQHTMERILSGLINKCCYVYVNDILIYGDSIKVRIANLNAVLGRISYVRDRINLEKLKFLAEETDFPGHTIGKSGLTATNKDISAIREYKNPSSKKDMLSIFEISRI